MQINLNHVQRDSSNKWLLSAVLDAIQYQVPYAFQAACRTAGGLSQWLDDDELETLLSAHENELKQVRQHAKNERLKKNKEKSQVLYAYDKTNDDLKFAVGRTTLDSEQMTFTNSQFKNWVQRQLDRNDITVSQREDLIGANYWLSKAEQITIRNGI